MYVSPIREPLIRGEKDYSQVTKDILAPMAGKPSKYWYMGITLSSAALFFGAWATFMTVYYGIGTWGLNKTVGWVGYHQLVWWVGIGHAGTFISAILLLFRQKMENKY